MLQRLADAGLVKGRTVGIDATTLEANAALRSIVRRDTGEIYDDFLTKLAQASGIETPTRADLARVDRQRKRKGSNADWTHPHDPDAKVTKMKDGRTHLAHKAEHAVDLETGAIIGVTVQDADEGDTTTSRNTLIEAAEHQFTRRRPRCMLRQWPWTSQRPSSSSPSRMRSGISSPGSA
jgi:transposase